MLRMTCPRWHTLSSETGMTVIKAYSMDSQSGMHDFPLSRAIQLRTPESDRITEQPHKLPYYSALLVVLTHNQYLLDEPFAKSTEPATKAEPTEVKAEPVDVKMETGAEVKLEPAAGDVKMEVKEEDSEDEQLKRRISWLVVKDLNERFGAWVKERQWLKVRLCVSTDSLSRGMHVV